jgi:glycosyltransferase involved in cell wall biosynthesis
LPDQRRKVLFITLEPIGKQMAGPAIRCVELAAQLSKEFETAVFSPRPGDLPASWSEERGFQLAAGVSRSKLYELAADFDVLFIQGNVLKPYPRLSGIGKYLVVDLYDPYLLSLLAQFEADPVSASASYRLMHQVLEKHMIAADFSVCASERQRDYWIGRYCAIGRLTPEMHHYDPSLRKLIDVVPFGLPAGKPERTGRGMKGRVAGIEENDFVLLWGGGIWEWFDPLTVIQAVAALSHSHPRLKLFFMGWKSPNPQVPPMRMATRARDLAQSLGVLDRNVFFGNDWIPYQERVNYLLDADAAVSAHFDLPETRFSFRTRVLDYLWAGLPILTTGGDHLAELVASRGAGLALPYGDVPAWSSAIARLMDNPVLTPSLSTNATLLAAQFTWDKAAEPLRKFCRDPHHLPAFSRVTMPSIVERMGAVYSRGGRDLVMKRTRDVLEDFLRR